MNAFGNTDCGGKRGEEQTSHLGGDNNLSGHIVADCSKGACNDCAEILHGLNNVLASVLLNAQVMEWKLPSYSRSKRYLHEIERNAQRGGELVKCLLGRLEVSCPKALSDGRPGSEIHPMAANKDAMVTDDQGPAIRAEELQLEAAAQLAPVHLAARKRTPHTIV